MRELILNNPEKAQKKYFELIYSCLKKGGVIALQTDTIYGLSCLASNRQAIKRIREIKGREDSKAFLVLVSSLEMIKNIAYLNKEQAEYLKKNKIFEKKPTTVILNLKKKFPPELLADKGMKKIALRLPKSQFLIKMIGALNEALVSTSLNISGAKNINNPDNIKKVFPANRLPDLVINSGICRKRKSSSLIDLSSMSDIELIRK